MSVWSRGSGGRSTQVRLIPPGIAYVSPGPDSIRSTRSPMRKLIRSRDKDIASSRSIFSGKRTAQAALDLAVERGNRLLRQFERANPDR